MPEDGIPKRGTNRRDYLRATGAVLGGMAVAGCSGDGDATEPGTDGDGNDGSGGDGESGTDSSGSERVEMHMGEPNWANEPSAYGFNPFSTGDNIVGILGDTTTEVPFQYNARSNEWTSGLLSDWDFDGKNQEASFTIREGLTFHHTDGKEVLAEDLATQYWIEEYIQASGIWTVVDSIEVAGERTLNFELSSQMTINAFADTFTNERTAPLAPKDIWGPKLEALRDAGDPPQDSAFDDPDEEIFGGNDDLKAAVEDVTGESWKEPEQEHSASLWTFTGRDDTSLYFELHESHPDAENVNWTELRRIWTPEKIQEIEEFQKYNTHWLKTPQKQARAAFGDQYKRIDTPDPMGVAFNLPRNPESPTSDWRVRHALAYVLDNEGIVSNTKDFFDYQRPPCGVLNEMQEDLIDGDVLSAMDPYEKDDERAAQLLRDAGFTKQNDSWITPEGDQWSLTIEAPGWEEHMYVTPAKVYADQLSEFGIDSTHSVLSSSKFFQQQGAQSRESLVVWLFGGSQYPTQFFPAFNTWQQAVLQGRKEGSAQANYTVQVPELGDAGGDRTMDVNVADQGWDGAENSVRAQLRSSIDDDEIRSHVTKLAWAFNQDLPVIPAQRFFDSKIVHAAGEFESAGEDDPVWGVMGGNSIARAAQAGAFTAIEDRSN